MLPSKQFKHYKHFSTVQEENNRVINGSKDISNSLYKFVLRVSKHSCDSPQQFKKADCGLAAHTLSTMFLSLVDVKDVLRGYRVNNNNPFHCI